MTYRNRQVRSREQIEARRKVRQGAHSLVLTTQGDDSVAALVRQTAKATRWWEDLRRSRTTVYGSLFRFLDIAIARGVEKETLMLIPDTIRAYIENEYDPQNGGKLAA